MSGVQCRVSLSSAHLKHTFYFFFCILMQGSEVVCDIYSAVTLTRSDKRKDRVEISPEKLIEVTVRSFVILRIN